MKRRRCQQCHTWLRFAQGDDSVSCGECGARYTIETRARVPRDALQAGIQRALRKALAAAPSACKRCQGTGLKNPMAAERAVARALSSGQPYPTHAVCPYCVGGKKAGAR